jgi:hypothetical protein
MLQIRGGVPAPRQVTAPASTDPALAVAMPFATFWMILRNKGAAVVHVFFNQADALAGVNYVQLPVAAAATPHGEWSGPVEVDIFCDCQIWLQSAGAACDVEVVGFQRRG